MKILTIIIGYHLRRLLSSGSGSFVRSLSCHKFYYSIKVGLRWELGLEVKKCDWEKVELVYAIQVQLYCTSVIMTEEWGLLVIFGDD